MAITGFIRTIRGRIVAVLGGIFVTIVIASTPAYADEEAPQSGVQSTWGLAPATSESESDGRVSLRHEVDPGTEISDYVLLTNYSEQEESFKVYASDGVVTADGNFDLIDDWEKATDAGTWISFGTAENAKATDGGGLTMSVPAQSSVLIPLTISVPKDATPGDHPAGIAAELTSDNDDSVHMMTRVGVRAHVRVSGDIATSLDIESVKTAWNFSWNPLAKGTATVTYTVRNTGNVRSGAEIDESIASLFGWAPDSLSQEIREILPGQSIEVISELQTLPLFFSSGTIQAAPLTVGDDTQVASTNPGLTSYRIWSIPWAQLIYLAVVGIIIVVVFQSRKRSAQRVEQKIAAAVAAATKQVED